MAYVLCHSYNMLRVCDALYVGMHPLPVITGELVPVMTGHPVGLVPSRTGYPDRLGTQSDWYPVMTEYPVTTGTNHDWFIIHLIFNLLHAEYFPVSHHIIRNSY